MERTKVQDLLLPVPSGSDSVSSACSDAVVSLSCCSGDTALGSDATQLSDAGPTVISPAQDQHRLLQEEGRQGRLWVPQQGVLCGNRRRCGRGQAAPHVLLPDWRGDQAVGLATGK